MNINEIRELCKEYDELASLINGLNSAKSKNEWVRVEARSDVLEDIDKYLEGYQVDAILEVSNKRLIEIEKLLEGGE